MTDKKKALNKSSPESSQINNISKAAQCERLLAALIEFSSVTTYEAREQLNIVSPATRIKELKAAGHSIFTNLETLTDGAGNEHPHSARYVLLKLAGGKA